MAVRRTLAGSIAAAISLTASAIMLLPILGLHSIPVPFPLQMVARLPRIPSSLLLFVHSLSPISSFLLHDIPTEILLRSLPALLVIGEMIRRRDSEAVSAERAVLEGRRYELKSA